MLNFSNKNSFFRQMDGYTSPCLNCTGTASTPYTPSVQSVAQMPTGIPTGPAYSTPMPVQQTPSTAVPQVPITSDGVIPETVLNTSYTQGYLRTQIGRKVKVEFLIGTNIFVDREGTLIDVGASYIILREAETDDLILCDMYSIKFVKFYY
ncbi:hypothetical protein [Acetivibrio clariflavus]|uniref:Alginate lyase n=1 Tax=Acetivibrio clariflavus (strain DSM 19732 / NBRC 101661 / EBR45) TaxID=720554 RepID=G8LUI5_ACECE|nr:hypothetical protein [Acetivibrio clariflavus]AEV70633.1 hypothetical protein Clocl_4206 [Acetivibrio clariflavus DSM 19732]